MNKFLITILVVCTSVYCYGQSEKNPYPKTIQVTGSAEMEIIPDEIYVRVDLKEYEKKGQPKVSIDKIRQEFLTDAKSIGLPDSAITIATYEGSATDIWERKKKRKDELLASISYQVKLKTSTQLDALVNILDDNATQNFAIIKMSHSRITELRKQLKIQAIKAAKEKAKYLTEAIDEKLGKAITIIEPDENYFTPFENVMSYSNTVARDQYKPEQIDVNFQKIKLKFNVSVVFSITD